MSDHAPSYDITDAKDILAIRHAKRDPAAHEKEMRLAAIALRDAVILAAKEAGYDTDVEKGIISHRDKAAVTLQIDKQSKLVVISDKYPQSPKEPNSVVYNPILKKFVTEATDKDYVQHPGERKKTISAATMVAYLVSNLIDEQVRGY